MQHLKIDFVADVVCPWCIVGLQGLRQALDGLRNELTAEIAFQPFELNPDMAPEGEDLVEHITAKYGSTAEQFATNRAMLRSRAEQVGFTISDIPRGRIYNTFDAHRLLHWAHSSGRQLELELELCKAYFTDGANVSDVQVLAGAASSAGLPPDEALEVLRSGRYGPEVRAAERLWINRGISSVPAAVINGQWLISGGQPPLAFDQALRRVLQALESSDPAQ